MWVDPDLSSLRQGDIVGLSFFPHWSHRRAQVVSAPGGDVTGMQMPELRATHRSDQGAYLAAVLSHDCDIENPRTRSGVLLAPIVKVPASPGSEQHDRIMSSSVHQDGQYEFIQLFPLEFEQSFPVADKSAVVDFSALISFGKPEEVIPELLASKQAELSDGTRSALKLKLAAFVGRP